MKDIGLNQHQSFVDRLPWYGSARNSRDTQNILLCIHATKNEHWLLLYKLEYLLSDCVSNDFSILLRFNNFASLLLYSAIHLHDRLSRRA